MGTGVSASSSAAGGGWGYQPAENMTGWTSSSVNHSNPSGAGQLQSAQADRYVNAGRQAPLGETQVVGKAAAAEAVELGEQGQHFTNVKAAAWTPGAELMAGLQAEDPRCGRLAHAAASA